jgi:hypothetical protein
MRYRAIFYIMWAYQFVVRCAVFICVSKKKIEEHIFAPIRYLMTISLHVTVSTSPEILFKLGTVDLHRILLGPLVFDLFWI